MKTLHACRKIVLVALLSFSLVAPISSSRGIPQSASECGRYVRNGEEFSVLLPETPSIAITSRPNKPDDGRYVVRIYGAYGDGIVYLVISQNNPKRAKRLDTFINEFKDTLPYTRTKKSLLTFNRELQLDGFVGKRYRLTYYKDIEGIADFYASRNHVYTVVAAGADETNSLVQKFLQSFSLNETTLRDTIATATKVAPITQTITASTQPAEQVFTHKEVARQAFAVSRPGPPYTEEARRNQVMGTVVLKAVFSSTGRVTSLEVIKGLEHGLTDKALEAASKLKFHSCCEGRKIRVPVHTS